MAAAQRNDLRRCTGALLGIIQGVLADGELNDAEILFLRNWLANNTSALASWPGNAIAASIAAALADGVIETDERLHLTETLRQIVGGALDELASSTHVTELALDAIDSVTIEGHSFCLTGQFLLGPRSSCERLITERGGTIAKHVSRTLDYLVLGGLGSEEWKHGSFGTKIERAMQFKATGAPIIVVHEDPFAAALMQR